MSLLLKLLKWLQALIEEHGGSAIAQQRISLEKERHASEVQDLNASNAYLNRAKDDVIEKKDKAIADLRAECNSLKAELAAITLECDKAVKRATDAEAKVETLIKRIGLLRAPLQTKALDDHNYT